MDFDKPKVYGDTSITDGLVFSTRALRQPAHCTAGNQEQKKRPHSDNCHTAQMACSLANHSLNLDLVGTEGADLLQAAATVHLEEVLKGGQL